jgi:hypothetical protein
VNPVGLRAVTYLGISILLRRKLRITVTTLRGWLYVALRSAPGHCEL